MKSQKFIGSGADKKAIIFIALATFFVLISIMLIRGGRLVGGLSYYYAGSAEDFLNGRYHGLAGIGWTSVFALFGNVFGIENTCRYLPLLFGVTGAVLYFVLASMLLGVFLSDEKNRFWLSFASALFFVLSPPFLRSFAVCDTVPIAFFLSLLAAILLFSRQYLYGFILTFATLFFNIYFTVILFLMLLILLIFNKKMSLVLPSFLKPSFVRVLLSLFFLGGGYILLSTLGAKTAGFRGLIFEFGGYGLRVFTIALSFFGFLILWKKKSENAYIFAICIFLAFLSFYTFYAIIFLSAILPIIAALGLMWMLDRKWESRFIKNFTIFALLFGIGLSGLSAIYSVADIEPSAGKFEGLNVLRAISNNSEVVFSSQANGLLIEHVAKRTSVVNEFSNNDRLQDANKLLYTRRLEGAMETINKYNITYFFIDKEMERALEEDEGLLFVLKYSKRFKKMYHNGEVGIWKLVVRPRTSK